MNSIFTSLKKCAAAIIGGVMVVGLAACGAKTTQPDTTNLRLINLAPENGPLDLQIGDTPTTIASAVPSLGSSGYKSFESGAIKIKVKNATGSILLDTTVVLAGKAYTTLLVYGGAASFSSTLISDVETPPITAANFRIALGHYGLGLPTMDMYLLAPNQAIKDATPSSAKVPLASQPLFNEIAAGNLSLKLTTAGTKDVIFDSDAFTFVAGKTYFIAAYANGSSLLPSVSLNQVNTDGSIQPLKNKIARLRAFGGSSDSGKFSMLKDGVGLFVDLDFAAAGNKYTNVNAGATNLRFELANTPGTSAASVATTLEGGADYTVVLAGSILQNNATATVYADRYFPSSATKAQVRFVNATSGVGAIDTFINKTASISNVPQNTASKYVDIDAGTASFAVSAKGTNSILLSLPVVRDQSVDSPTVPITAGAGYTIFVVGQFPFLKGGIERDN